MPDDAPLQVARGQPISALNYLQFSKWQSGIPTSELIPLPKTGAKNGSCLLLMCFEDLPHAHCANVLSAAVASPREFEC